jgi:hypothetical protein
MVVIMRRTSQKLKNTAEHVDLRVIHFTFVREVPDSNLGRITGYSARVFSFRDFPESLQTISRDSIMYYTHDYHTSPLTHNSLSSPQFI